MLYYWSGFLVISLTPYAIALELIAEIGKILTVLFTSSLKFIFGLIISFGWDMGFLPSVLLTIAGGMAGVYFFAILDKTISRLWNKYFAKPNLLNKVKFTTFRRLMVRIKGRYGILGIAFLTPILFQIPIGTILAMRLIKDLRKVSLYMLASLTFFSVLLSGLYYGGGFNDKIQELINHYVR